MARGNAASELAVPKAIVTGSATAAMNFLRGTRTIRAIGSKTPNMKTTKSHVERHQKSYQIEQNPRARARDRVRNRSAHSHWSEVHHNMGELQTWSRQGSP